MRLGLGIPALDTAPQYGEIEQFLGRCLRERVGFGRTEKPRRLTSAIHPSRGSR